LLHDLKEARDRLNQGPDNSSRPPNSQVPWQKASPEVQTESHEEDGEEEETEPERAGEGQPSDSDSDSAAQAGKEPDKNPPPKTKPGKPGKREGAPGYGRSVELPV
jgi:hypothetical protein